MMNFSNFYIKEFVAFPKGEEEITIGDKKYYKSKELTEKAKAVVRKYADADVKDIVIKLIDSEILTPVFIDKNISQYIINYIIQKNRHHGYGVATFIDKKGYVFINPKLFFVDSELVYKILVHELMHVIAFRKSKDFYVVNFDIIKKFYLELFSKLFSAKPKCVNAYIENFVNSLIKLDKKNELDLKYHSNLLNKIETCSSLNDKEYNYKANELINFIHAAFYDFDHLLSAPRNLKETFLETYKKISGSSKKVDSWFCQEFWTPTEIISILASITPNHLLIKKTIKLMK